MTTTTFHTKLHGVTHANGDGSHRQDLIEELADALEERGPLELAALREADSAFDRNAIGVFDTEGRQLGYLSRQVAKSLAPLMDVGIPVSLIAEVVTGGGLSQNYGVNVRVSYDPEDRRPTVDRRSIPPSSQSRPSTPVSTAEPPKKQAPHLRLSVAATPAGVPKWVSTEEFLAAARRHGLDQVAVSIDYEVTAEGYVQRFNYVLLAPFNQPSTAKPGTVSHLESLPVQDARLRDWRGRDDGGSLWFQDGYRLAAARELCEPTHGTYPPFGREVSAFERVRGFGSLLERIGEAGLQPQIIGSGMGPIIEWAKNTARADEDSEFRAEMDASHGPVRRHR